MIAGGNKAKNAWGGAVTIKVSSDKYSYVIESSNVPKKNCIDLVTSLAQFIHVYKNQRQCDE